MVVDLLWEAHNLPIARAVFELFHVARTDPDMAKKITTTLNQGVQLVHGMIANLIPKLAAQPSFVSWLQLAETQMRGTVILSSIPGAKCGFATWPAVRADIMHKLDALYAPLVSIA